MGVEGSGLRVYLPLLAPPRHLLLNQGSGFRVQGAGFRVQSSGFRVQGSGFRVQGSGLGVEGVGFKV